MWNDIAEMSTQIRSASPKVKIALGLGFAVICATGIKFALPLAQQSTQTVSNIISRRALPALEDKVLYKERKDSMLMARAMDYEGSLINRSALKSGAIASDISPVSEFERRINRNAWMDVEVKKCDDAIKIAMQTARTFGAEVYNMNSQNLENGQGWASISFAVAPDKLDALMDALNDLGLVKSRRSQTVDLTEQYVDLKSQLSNSEQIRDRLISLLNTRTGHLKDVLEVERELSRTTGQIESLKGKIRYLQAQTDLARLEISLREKQSVPVAPNMFLQRLEDSFKILGAIFMNTISGLFAVAGFALGLSVYLGLLMGFVIVGRRLYKRAAR